MNKTLKKVRIRDFVDELLKRIEDKQTIDCCVDEIRTFARLVRDRLGDETIEIEWKD
ncbi:MAG: hypothetical protein ABIJ09_26555 [Pseudomonadota bacterium]